MFARTTIAPTFALTAAALLALTGCSPTSTDTPSPTDAPAGASVSMENGWVKAAESGMSAAFGELENTGSSDVTVVSATTEASTSLELHETVENEAGEMIMREKTGGFVIAAGDRLSLEPGGNHIMLMGLTEPLRAGDEVTFTLTFADDSTYEYTVPAKDYAGANENYEGGDDMDMTMDEHADMGGHSE